MATRTREINDEACGRFEAEMDAIRASLGRFTIAFTDFEREEWLGGDIKSDNNEVPPRRCASAMAKVREARRLLNEADHEVAMFRAVGDEDKAS